MAAQPTFLAPPTPVAEPIEDHRITRAREVLACSQAADSIGEGARWWGSLETTVEVLLEVIAERTP